MEPEKKNTQQNLKSFFTDDKQHYVFHFELDKEQLPCRTDVSLKASTILEDALQEAIAQCNQLIAAKQLALIPDLSLYKVRLTGKNFHPKTDLPALSMFQKICDLKVQEFAVQILDKKKALVETKTQESKQKQLAQKLQKIDIKEKISKPEASQEAKQV